MLGMAVDGIEAGLVFGLVAMVSATLFGLQRQVGGLVQQLKRLRAVIASDWDQPHGQYASAEATVWEVVTQSPVVETLAQARCHCLGQWSEGLN